MEINFDQELKTITGDSLKDERGKEVTLSVICVESLLSNHPEDVSIRGQEKMDRWELAKRCKGKAELTLEELANIKNLVGRSYPANVVGPAWQLLEQK